MLCRRIGIDPAMLSQPDGRVTGETSRALWHELVQQTGDQNIGLHIGEAFNPASLGIVGYVLFNCQTFGQVLDKLSVYMSLFSQGISLTVTSESGYVFCDWEIVDQVKNYRLEEPRQPIEVTASALITAAKILTGHALRPLTVWFQYACPADMSNHQRIFGSSVKFAQPKNRMVLDAACLHWPVISANTQLLSTFEDHAEAMLADLNQADTYTRQVTQEIRRSLTGEVPTVEAIAHSLTTSVRHLQRSLQAEGTSYQQLLEDNRKELALLHLRQPKHSIHDVAFLLGFSEPSAFHRAFKRWTGQTPREYRQDLRIQP